MFGFWYAWFYALFVLPVSAMAWYIFFTEELGLLQSFAKATKVLLAAIIKHAGMMIITAIFSLLVAILVQSPVFYIAFELANDFIGFTENNAHYIIEVIIIFISLLTLFSSIIFLAINCIMNYRSMIEIREATQLLSDIESISPRKKMYGTLGER
jgi:hypothetical protein